MTYDDMVFKMDPMHRDSLRRMLAVNEVPEPVMVRYFAMKRYLDKLSAHITTVDLLRMAEDCGFNLETGRFDTEDKQDEAKQESVSTLKEEEVVENKQIAEAEARLQKLAESDKYKIPEPEPEPVEEVIEPPKFEVEPQYKDGDPVTVYREGEPVQGVVKGYLPKGPSEEVTYKVEIKGEIVEISEDDIE